MSDNYFLELESKLASSNFKGEEFLLDEIIHTEFQELGASGLRYSKPSVIKVILTRNSTDLDIRDFQVNSLTSEVTLVTYISMVQDVKVSRCSIWLLEDEVWKIRFHQGTPIPNE